MRSPSSTPAGIFTDSVLCCLMRPAPLQVGQGSGSILPVPWHCGQVCWIEKKPCEHAHLAAAVAGGAGLGLRARLGAAAVAGLAASIAGMRILVSVPRAACSSEISRL